VTATNAAVVCERFGILGCGGGGEVRADSKQRFVFEITSVEEVPAKDRLGRNSDIRK
jgi:hypothetical protein